MSAMFGRAKKKPVVEVKAGRAKLENKQVTSDPSKGLLKFEIVDDLIVITWGKRDGTDEPETFYSVPGELEFIKVPQCADGRMYYLKFTSSDQKEFFWFQEPDASGDAKLEEAIKNILNSPDEDEPVSTTTTTTQPPPVTTPISKPSSTSSSSTTSSYPTTPSTTTSKPSSTSSSSTSSSTPAPAFDIFKDIFSTIQPKSRINLSSILTPENVSRALTDESIQKELKDFLPESLNGRHDLMELPHTPQFNQAVEQLNHAIMEGHGSEIVQQLGYEPSLGATGSVEGFLNAIQQGVDKQLSKNEKKSEDDKMKD